MDRRSLFFDWGSSTAYKTSLRSGELLDRIWWFINIRWFAIFICMVLWVVSLQDWFPVNLTPDCFLWTVLALSALNVLYLFIGRRLLLNCGDGHGQLIRTFIRVQILGDFILLSYLNYMTGTIETPVLMMFMPHIILASLFFSRRKSLVIVFLAWFFAVFPLTLECLGYLPVVSIFDGHFKALVLDNGCLVTRAVIVAIGLSYLTIWYLISEITLSLQVKEGQLEDAIDMLQKMDKEKTQATLRATHELKAPFAAIKSYVYTLRDGYCGELPEKAMKVVNRIGDRCDRLREKISDIIHLSNIRTLVVTDIDMVPVNLFELLKKEVEEGNLRGREKQIEVHLVTDPIRVFIDGSKAHLKTLFSNIIRNAVIYSRNGQRVEVSLKVRKHKVTVAVADSGIGIPSGQLDKIFEEHFRSNHAVTHNPNGSGLGLPMVKELVRLHSAVLTVESEVEEGSTFKVTFKTVIPEKKGESDD